LSSSPYFILHGVRPHLHPSCSPADRAPWDLRLHQMSDSQGSHNFASSGYHPDLHFSPGESATPVFGAVTSNDSVFNSYDDIRHYDAQEIQLNQQHVIPGPSRMDYLEPSRQTDIPRAGHQLSTYSFAGDTYSADPQSTSTRLPGLRLETISEISSTNYNQLQSSPDRFPSFPGPSGPPASPHRVVPNRLLYPLREPHMGSVHLSGGSYHPSSADVESSRFNPMSAPHIPSVSSIPISIPDWPRPFSSAFSSSTLELDHATISSGSPPTTIAHSPSQSSAAQSTAKKKKSKMHQCVLCGREFPRYELIHFCFAFTQWTIAQSKWCEVTYEFCDTQ